MWGGGPRVRITGVWSQSPDLQSCSYPVDISIPLPPFPESGKSPQPSGHSILAGGNGSPGVLLRRSTLQLFSGTFCLWGAPVSFGPFLQLSSIQPAAWLLSRSLYLKLALVHLSLPLSPSLSLSHTRLWRRGVRVCVQGTDWLEEEIRKHRGGLVGDSCSVNTSCIIIIIVPAP